ncbi:MAG: hypothetical protein KJ069_28110 [Anaerolineae bacterium]|nr:hypothetical protein [Anaerolineae bacterium]
MSLYHHPPCSGVVFGWRLRPPLSPPGCSPDRVAPPWPTGTCLIHPVTAVYTHPSLHRQLYAGSTAVPK